MSQPYFDEYGQPIIPDTTMQQPGIVQAANALPAPAPSLADLQAQEPQAGDAGGREVTAQPGASLPLRAPLDPGHDTLDRAITQVGSSPSFQTTEDPEAPAAAPISASANPQAPTVPKQTGPLTDDQKVEQGMQAYSDAEKAKGMADLGVQQSQADKAAGAEQDYRNQLSAADKEYQTRRENLERQADQETATWLQNQQVLAEKEPTRSRYWESQSGFGKAMWMMSVGLAAFANSRTPGAQNMASQMLMHEVEADTQAQKDRLAREVDVGNQKGKLLEKKQSQRLHDSEDDYTKNFQKLESIRRELLDRAKRPGSAEAMAVAAGAEQSLVKMQFDMAEKKRTEGMAAKDKAETRKFELQKQGIEIDAQRARQTELIKHQEREGDLNRKKDYDLAQERIDAKIAEIDAKKGPGGNPNVWALPQESTGFHSVNPQTGAKEDVAFDKDSRKEVYTAVSNANDRYMTLRRVNKALSSDTDTEVLLKQDPSLVSDMISLGYTTARQMDPRGIVTDTDFSHGLEASTGADFSTAAGRAAFVTGLKANRGAVKNWVTKEANDMRIRVPKNLDMYRNSNLQKGKVNWEPPSMEAPVAKAKTADDTEVQNGTNTAKPFISTEEEYNKVKANDPESLPTLLPEASDAIKEMTNDGHDNLATGTNTVNSSRAKALKALDDLAAKDPTMAKAVTQSKAAVNAEAKKAFEKGQKAYNEARAALEGPYIQYGGAHYTQAEVEDQLKRANLTNIDHQQIRDLLDEVNNFKGLNK